MYSSKRIKLITEVYEDKVRWREETKLMFSLKGVRSKDMAPRGRVTERWTARALGLDLERLDGKLIAN